MSTGSFRRRASGATTCAASSASRNQSAPAVACRSRSGSPALWTICTGSARTGATMTSCSGTRRPATRWIGSRCSSASSANAGLPASVSSGSMICATRRDSDGRRRRPAAHAAGVDGGMQIPRRRRSMRTTRRRRTRPPWWKRHSRHRRPTVHLMVQSERTQGARAVVKPLARATPTPRDTPAHRVVVPAAAGSRPVAHPFRPAVADVCTSGATARGPMRGPDSGPWRDAQTAG